MSTGRFDRFFQALSTPAWIWRQDRESNWSHPVTMSRFPRTASTSQYRVSASHNPLWRETFVNMHRMTRPGGIVAFTCASRGRLEHGTTRTRPFDSPSSLAIGWDYYRNLNREDFEALPLATMFERHAFFRNEVSKDLYFAGRKSGGASRPLRLDLSEFWRELSAANTLVVSDQQAGTRLRRIISQPLKWAERLPDPVYQNFVVRWTALETALRRVFGGK